jgi:tetratricopeptide (TPR) repeat protein
LSEALGGLPLAHEQAAAYCERLDVSLADYRNRFEASPTRLLDDAKYAPAEYHDRLTVATSFALAIDEAAKRHPAAEPLIVHAALLAPEPIPLFLFSDGREQFGEPLSKLVDDGLDEAVAALRDFALVDSEAIVDERDASMTTKAIRLHRLVREVAAARPKGEARVQFRRALVAALAAVYPNNGFLERDSWSRCEQLMPHLVANCQMEMADAGTNLKCADLLNRAGEYLHRRAAYASARPLLERALVIREKELGPEHPDTARSLYLLGSLLQDQGDLAKARPLHERALAIFEKALGPESPDMAGPMTSLASLLRDQSGDLTKARQLYERALTIREKKLGPEHPATARSLNGLAGLLQEQGHLTRARQLYERALAIFEKTLGPEHPSTATILNNLARLLQDQGDLAEARPLYERALAIRKKELGGASRYGKESQQLRSPATGGADARTGSARLGGDAHDGGSRISPQ